MTLTSITELNSPRDALDYQIYVPQFSDFKTSTL